MATIPWADLWPILLLGFGLTYIVTGTTIGYWARLSWCFALQWSAFTRYWWPVITCPPCNAFWSGGFIGYLITGDHLYAVQSSIALCGLVGIVQKIIGGNGIAPSDEDFEVLLGIEEEEE